MRKAFCLTKIEGFGVDDAIEYLVRCIVNVEQDGRFGFNFIAALFDRKKKQNYKRKGKKLKFEITLNGCIPN